MYFMNSKVSTERRKIFTHIKFDNLNWENHMWTLGSDRGAKPPRVETSPP